MDQNKPSILGLRYFYSGSEYRLIPGKTFFSQPTRAHSPSLAFPAETMIKQDLHGLSLHYSICLVN